MLITGQTPPKLTNLRGEPTKCEPPTRAVAGPRGRDARSAIPRTETDERNEVMPSGVYSFTANPGGQGGSGEHAADGGWTIGTIHP